MKIIAKILPCLLIIMLTAALIVTKAHYDTSNAFLGFSSLSTSVSCRTTK